VVDKQEKPGILKAMASSEIGEHWVGNYFHFFLVFKGLIYIVCLFTEGTSDIQYLETKHENFVYLSYD
jgi:hypothetical protein